MRNIFYILIFLLPCLTFSAVEVKKAKPLDPQEAYLIGKAKDLATLLDKDIIFAEGPVWRKSTGEVFFTDIPKNAIFRWAKKDGKSLFMRPAGLSDAAKKTKGGAGANGLSITKDGWLLICDSGNRRITKLNEKDFTVEVLADSFCEKRLNQPNDLCALATGEIFFTDPALWRFRSKKEPEADELDFNAVFCIDKDGKLNLFDISFLPNGIAASADGKFLYVANSRGDEPSLTAYELSEDKKTFKSKNIFCIFSIWENAKIIGTPDGLAVDKNGYIYATANGGLHIFSPDLAHLGYVEFPEQITNCCIIDDENSEPQELFITAKGGIWLMNIKKVLDLAK